MVVESSSRAPRVRWATGSPPTPPLASAMLLVLVSAARPHTRHCCPVVSQLALKNHVYLSTDRPLVWQVQSRWLAQHGNRAFIMHRGPSHTAEHILLPVLMAGSCSYSSLSSQPLVDIYRAYQSPVSVPSTCWWSELLFIHQDTCPKTTSRTASRWGYEGLKGKCKQWSWEGREGRRPSRQTLVLPPPITGVAEGNLWRNRNFRPITMSRKESYDVLSSFDQS